MALMVFMTVFTVALFIDGFFACDLGGAFWSPLGKKCGDPSYSKNISFFVYGSATLSVVVDLLLMAFALWRIFPLQIARAQKLSLYTIISLGWLAIAASLIRAIRTGQIIKSTDPTCEAPPIAPLPPPLPLDFAYCVAGAAWDIDLWASIEVNVGLICASAPALKPLIRKLLPNFIASLPEHSLGQYNNAFPNADGYLRASSRSAQDNAIELTDEGHDKSTARATRKELHLEVDSEARTDAGTMLDAAARDIKSKAGTAPRP
jgi:hypothetical protein